MSAQGDIKEMADQAEQRRRVEILKDNGGVSGVMAELRKRALADGDGGCERLEEKLEAHLLQQRGEIRRPSPIVEQPLRPITQCEMRVFYATSDDDRAFLESLARADFRHYSLPLTIEARRHEKNGVVAYQLEVRTVVKERDTGDLSLVILDKTVPVTRVNEAWKAAYYLVRRLMLHEVDEAFHLDDERIYDPHAKDEI